MKKITAMTLATSLSASPTVGAIDAIERSIEESNHEDNESNQKEKNIEALSSLIGTVTARKLNVRSTPDTSKSAIGVLYKGDTVSIISQESGWYKINYNGKIGYVSASYIKVEQSVSPDYTISAMNNSGEVTGLSSGDTLNVRSMPSTKGSVLYKLSNNTKVKLTGKVSNGWYRIEYNSKEGFVSGSFIKEISESTSTPVETIKGKVVNVASNDVLNVREKASTSSKILYTLKNNTSVNILEKLSNGWVKINYNGQQGYASGKYIEEVKESSRPEEKPETIAGTKYNVTADINLRKTASWSGEIIRVAKKGETLNVVSMDKDWAKINLNGTYAYAPSNYLTKSSESNTTKPEPEKPVTTSYTATADINLRDSASWSGNIVHVVKKGESVDVIEKGNDWAKIYYMNKIVYAPSQYLSNGSEPIVPDVPSTPEIPATVEYTVTADINMRETASWSGEIIRVIKSGELVNVVEYNETWSKIYDDGKYGYIPSQYIIKGNIDIETPEESQDNVKYTNYNFTMSAYIQQQQKANSAYTTAKYKEYINPANCNKYEFLELNKFREISVSRLNKLLSDNNAGVLINQGQAVYDTAKKFNIDPLYFIAQSIHETGYGKSTLAKGVTITEIADENKPIKDSNGNITGYQMIKLDAPVTVYNLYGIGAKDNLPTMPNRALILGTTYAYNKGWTSVEKAIEGAGEFVSNGYINSSKYNQNTLYKIRFNPNETYLWHQYATTPWYSRDIAKLMEKFDKIYESDVVFTYDKPRFIDSKEVSCAYISIKEDNSYLQRIGKEDIVEAKPWLE